MKAIVCTKYGSPYVFQFKEVNDSTLYTPSSAGIPKTTRGVGIPSACNDTLQVDRGVITSASSVAIPYNANSTEKTGWYIGSITNNANVRYDSVKVWRVKVWC